MAAPFIFLTGISGAGKSNVGQLLAKALALPFTDLDSLICSRQGKSVTKIFTQDGERAFRRIEKDSLSRAVKKRSSAVIALGGGTLLAPSNRAVVRKAGILVWLRVSCDEAARRLLRKTDRPLTMNADNSTLSRFALRNRLRELLRLRRAGFLAADLSVRVTNLTANQVCRLIRIQLAELNGDRVR